MKLDTRVENLLWGILIAVTTLGAVYAQIYSLSHGIYDIFQFLYLFPLIAVIYVFPHRGVLYTLSISWVYIFLIYLYGTHDSTFLAISTVWFFIYITIGIVVSSYAVNWRNEEKKYQGIFQCSQAGIFTLDLKTMRIGEINGKCASMLGYSREDLLDAPVDRIWQWSAERDAFIQRVLGEPRIADQETLLVNRDGISRWMLLSAGRMHGSSAIFSVVDITERKRAEEELQKFTSELEQRVRDRTGDLQRANEALKEEIEERTRAEAKAQAANRKLFMLSSITRHDILNQVSAIVVYLALIEEICCDRESRGYVGKIQHLTQLIQRQIDFTKDYQEIGADAPLWQNPLVAIKKVTGMFDPGRVKVVAEVDNFELYADPMFEKVIYNLIDNAIRHGGHATTVTFSFKEGPSGLKLICQDDGAGVPERVKESIFRREYYKNTGYGLFLSREILAMTGLSIRETGIPGKGARFEITAPQGRFRFANPSGKK